MSYAYTNKFAGDLRPRPESSPVRVNTIVRVDVDAKLVDAQKYDRAKGAPEYILNYGKALPTQPAIHALGRHYIKW